MNVRSFIRSFRFALEGISQAAKERNFRIHLLFAVLVLIAAMLTKISLMEWIILTLIIALVISSELMNTAIERVVDLASPAIHPLAKQAKDMAAGAVLVFAVASVIIGLLIFLPKWL